MKAIGMLSLVFFFSVLGCSSMDISSDWDPEADFANLKTYTFAERVSTADDDPRIFNDITIQRIRSALEAGFRSRGYERITSGDPDFQVGWHGSIDRKMNTTTIHNDYAYGVGYYDYYDLYYPRSKTYVNEWDEGTLIIDIIDPRKNVLIWRGTGTALVEESISAEARQQRLNDAVAKILKEFPPKQ